jgi:hypothetical protein
MPPEEVRHHRHGADRMACVSAGHPRRSVRRWPPGRDAVGSANERELGRGGGLAVRAGL